MCMNRIKHIGADVSCYYLIHQKLPCISVRSENQLYVKVCLEFRRMTEEAVRHFIIYEHM